MKKICFPALWLLVLFSACTNADPKKMAAELCDCMTAKKQVGTTAKKIILKAAQSNDFQTSLQEEIANLADDAQREEVEEDINTIALSFQEQKTKSCAEAVDKKYRVSKRDEAGMQQQLVEEMGKLDDCQVYAAFIKEGLKQQNNDAAATTGEPPAKKATAGEK